MIDKIWFTCCALHNMLLDDDNLDGDWHRGWDRENEDVASGKKTMFEGAAGNHDAADFEKKNGMSKNVKRNRGIMELRNFEIYDSSSRIKSKDQDWSYRDNDKSEPKQMKDVAAEVGWNKCYVTRTLDFDEFRNELVRHFSALWKQKKVVWPTRNRVKVDEEDVPFGSRKKFKTKK